MRQLGAIVLFAALAANLAYAQETSQPAQSQHTDGRPIPAKVYTVGLGVTAPELLPLAPFDIAKGTCTEKKKVKAVLSLIVDSEGLPQNIFFLQPFGAEFDRVALRLAAADRFKPGTHDGSPAAVAQSLEISVQACVDSTQDATGKQGFLLRLRSQPVQILGNLPEPPQEAAVTLASGVTAPIPLVHPEAEYTEEARKARNQGDCIISVIVDAQGMPQNPRVVRGLGMGLDQKAIEAVNKYRFKPAMKNGEPVPVGITVQVNFRLYRGPLPQPPQEAVHPPGTQALQSSQDNAPHPKWVGDGVTAPVPLVNPTAEYSEEALKANYQGTCLVYVIVDAQGMPQNPRVVRGLGMGLDQKAIEAVNKYKFKPAMKNGEPVPVGITVEVIFQLFRGSVPQGTSKLKGYMKGN